MTDETAPLRALIAKAIERLGRGASPEWIATAVLAEILPADADVPELIRFACRETLVSLAREAQGLPESPVMESLPTPESLRAEAQALFDHADALAQWRCERGAPR